MPNSKTTKLDLLKLLKAICTKVKVLLVNVSMCMQVCVGMGVTLA